MTDSYLFSKFLLPFPHAQVTRRLYDRVYVQREYNLHSAIAHPRSSILAIKIIPIYITSQINGDVSHICDAATRFTIGFTFQPFNPPNLCILDYADSYNNDH